MKYPYRIISNYAWEQDPTGIEYQMLRRWLHDHIGPAYELWQTELINDKIAVNFVCEGDAIMFALRWS